MDCQGAASFVHQATIWAGQPDRIQSKQDRLPTDNMVQGYRVGLSPTLQGCGLGPIPANSAIDVGPALGAGPSPSKQIFLLPAL